MLGVAAAFYTSKDVLLYDGHYNPISSIIPKCNGNLLKKPDEVARQGTSMLE